MKKISKYMRKRLSSGGVRVDSLAHDKAVAKITPFTNDEIMQLSIPSRIAFDLIKSGKAEENDFHTLAGAVNVSLVIAEKINNEAIDAVKLGRDALVRCWNRFQKTGLVRFDGPALMDVPIVLDMHEQMLALCTPLQITDAAQEVMKRIDQKNVAF